MNNNLKKDFPIFKTKIKGNPLIYFDNAATTQKPQQVIDAIVNFYSKNYATVHRGIYSFAEYATTLYENSRKKVADFINADLSEIVFTQGATDGINIIALSWAENNIQEGDEIIVTDLEHHSNLIPWQELAKRKNALLLSIPITNNGELDLPMFEDFLNKRTKLVAVCHVSNVLGTHNNIELITQKAHKVGAKVLIDAAQSIAHEKIDVKKINCDFLVFSGHKMLGPTGIGVLYINKKIHKEIHPFKFGGGMVFNSSVEKSTFKEMPYMLEAGTASIEQVIALDAAINYIQKNINFDDLKKHEAQLCAKLINGLQSLPGVKILGPVEQLKKNGHIVSFAVDKIHPHDIAAYLDEFGICVRAGHHCAQPLHQKLGIDSSIRISFYAYNTIEEVEFFINLMKKLLL